MVYVKGKIMNNEKQQLIGKKIRAAREEAGLSQEGLGKKVGFSAMGISHLEKGDRKIKIEDLQAIANALNISIDNFLAPVISKPLPSLSYRRGDEDLNDGQKKEEKEAMAKFDEYFKTL